MQMGKSSGDGERHFDQRVGVYAARSQEVEQWAVLMVVGDEPQLGPGAVIYGNWMNGHLHCLI